MTAFFLTATGTEIGKTYTGEALLAAWRGQGRNGLPLKPLMSGFSESALETSDAGRLLRASGKEVTPEAVGAVCRHRFEPPLAPNVAARQAGVSLSLEEIVRFVTDGLAAHEGPALVEGAGGVMSPVTDEATHIELMAALGLPVILVTAGYLGSVSHTLTAAACLDRAGLKIAAIVISRPPGDYDAPQDFAAELGRWRKESILPMRGLEDGEALAAALS